MKFHRKFSSNRVRNGIIRKKLFFYEFTTTKNYKKLIRERYRIFFFFYHCICSFQHREPKIGQRTESGLILTDKKSQWNLLFISRINWEAKYTAAFGGKVGVASPARTRSASARTSSTKMECLRNESTCRVVFLYLGTSTL